MSYFFKKNILRLEEGIFCSLDVLGGKNAILSQIDRHDQEIKQA